jgi:hypothetical protein
VRAEEGEAAAAVISVTGSLDLTAGIALVDMVRSAAEHGATRLEIDLGDVDDWTDEGAAALVDCRSVEGLDVHYRTHRGPGREALLAGFAAADERLADEDPEPTPGATAEVPGR